MFSLADAKESQLAAVAALEKEWSSAPWSEDGLKDFLLSPGALLLAAEGEDGALLGYLSCRHAADEAEIANLAVLPAARRCGIGASLLREALRRLASAGVCRVFLEVRASNAPAVSLYEKAGFVKIGVRRGFYAHPKEDALTYAYTVKGNTP